MKRRHIAIYGSILVVLALAVVLLEYYPRLRQKYWHWKHASTLQAGGYRLHVPKDWWVEEVDDESTLLADTQPLPISDRTVPMTIIVQAARYPKNVDGWTKVEMRTWGPGGAELLPPKKLADGDLICFNVRKAAEDLKLGRAVYLNCLGAGTIEIQFGGMPEDIPAFEAFVSSATRAR